MKQNWLSRSMIWHFFGTLATQKQLSSKLRGRSACVIFSHHQPFSDTDCFPCQKEMQHTSGFQISFATKMNVNSQNFRQTQKTASLIYFGQLNSTKTGDAVRYTHAKGQACLPTAPYLLTCVQIQHSTNKVQVKKNGCINKKSL